MSGSRCPRRFAASSVAVAVAAGVIAGVGSAGAAAAAGGNARLAAGAAGVFSISPGGHELVGAPGAVLSPTLVRNTTSQRLRVTVTPVLVTQGRTGVFAFGTAPKDVRAARRVLDVSRAGFAMRAHPEATVLERWRPDAGHRAADAAVIFRATPARAVRGVRVVDQLLGVDLLGLRGAPPARGRIEGLLVSDATAHRLQVTESLRNVGATFGTPSRIAVVVRAADGRVATRVALTPGVILPGVTRDFVAGLPVRLAPGRYTAVASASLHGPVPSVSRRFTVVAGGLLPAPSLVAGTVRTTGVVGGPAHVTMPVRNAGTRAGAPHGTVSLYPVHDGVASVVAVARAPLTGSPIAPGVTRTVQVSVGRLRRGPYETVVRYAPPFAPTAPRLQDFTPRPALSLWASLRRFVEANGVLLVAGLALLAAVAYLLRRRRDAASPPRSGVRLRPLR